MYIILRASEIRPGITDSLACMVAFYTMEGEVWSNTLYVVLVHVWKTKTEK